MHLSMIINGNWIHSGSATKKKPDTIQVAEPNFFEKKKKKKLRFV